MSRLDIFSVAVVAVCVIAIVVLLAYTTDLFKKDAPMPPRDEQVYDDPYEDEVVDPAEYDDYGDYDNDEPRENADSLSDIDYNEGPSTPTPAPEANPDPKQEIYQDADTYSGKGSGDYLVLAGSFRVRQNADIEASRIRKLGYPDAEVVLFNRGAYATVLVSRYESKSEASSLVSKLKGEKVEAYVHLKRGARQ